MKTNHESHVKLPNAINKSSGIRKNRSTKATTITGQKNVTEDVKNHNYIGGGAFLERTWHS